MAPPLPELKLKQIAKDACDAALSTATTYNHPSTHGWNDTIISKILQSLISETSSADSPSTYKFMVNSTIIQHSAPLASSKNADDDSAPAPSVGRRGMNTAAGAYWNSEKDGMWNYKYEGGEEKGMDVVVCIMWVGV